MHFEVQLPPTQGQGRATTLTIEANNWLSALRAALQRSDLDAPLSQDLVCDIQPEHTFSITDVSTRRVFLLRGVDAEPEYPVEINPDPSRFARSDAAVPDPISNAATMDLSTARKQLGLIPPPAQTKAPSSAPLDIPAPVRTPKPKPAKPAPLPKPTNLKHRDPNPPKAVAGEVHSKKAKPTPPAPRPSAPSMVVDAPGVASNVPPPGAPVQSTPTVVEQPAFLAGPKAKSKPVPQPTPTPKQDVSSSPKPTQTQVADTAIEDVFLDIYDLFDLNMSMTQGIDFVIDLAVRAIRAESGAVLFASPDGRELRFATARGPHAHTMMELSVPIQEGFAGYTTRSGISVMSSNPSEDNRFYKHIATKTGYVPSSVLCSPIEHEGRVYGCIQLLNKYNNSFDDVDCNALNYIGQQMGRFVFESLAHK